MAALGLNAGSPVAAAGPGPALGSGAQGGLESGHSGHLDQCGVTPGLIVKGVYPMLGRAAGPAVTGFSYCRASTIPAA